MTSPLELIQLAYVEIDKGTQAAENGNSIASMEFFANALKSLDETLSSDVRIAQAQAFHALAMAYRYARSLVHGAREVDYLAVFQKVISIMKNVDPQQWRDDDYRMIAEAHYVISKQYEENQRYSDEPITPTVEQIMHHTKKALKAFNNISQDKLTDDDFRKIQKSHMRLARIYCRELSKLNISESQQEYRLAINVIFKFKQIEQDDLERLSRIYKKISHFYFKHSEEYHIYQFAKKIFLFGDVEIKDFYKAKNLVNEMVIHKPLYLIDDFLQILFIIKHFYLNPPSDLETKEPLLENWLEEKHFVELNNIIDEMQNKRLKLTTLLTHNSSLLFAMVNEIQGLKQTIAELEAVIHQLQNENNQLKKRNSNAFFHQNEVLLNHSAEDPLINKRMKLD